MNRNLQLHSATDVIDDFLRAGKLLNKSHLDQLMAVLAAEGVRQHEWVVNYWTSLYQAYPPGFDLLQYAVEAAHRHGLTLHAVFKPFEAVPHYGPHLVPTASGRVWSDLYGTLSPFDEFVVAHPEYCMRRRSGGFDSGEPLAGLRLIKDNDAPCAIKPGHLSIWTSDRLGTWRRHADSWQLTERVEMRYSYPHTRKCRVLAIDGLRIPASERYIEIRLSDDCHEKDFANRPESLMELVGADGTVLPMTPGSGPGSMRGFLAATRGKFLSQINPCMSDPAFREFAFCDDLENIWSQTRDIGWPWRLGALIDLTQTRRATVARGVNETLPLLHPVYPEVRSYWLGQIRGLLECGVDGVNVRPSSHYHFRTTNALDYGFNEPILAQLPEPDNRAAVADANGAAFTGFLREARELVDQYGKQLGVHVLSSAFHERDDEGKQLDFALIDWQWRDWIREIADYAEFRGMMGFH
ncbi:MAG: hypothetical protein ABR497_11290, partial [Kiritimatiellia bacterium]